MAEHRTDYAFASDGSGSGAGIGIVLCHGFTGAPKSVTPWAEHLASNGFAVRLPLLPGHGTTWQELARTAWQPWYATVEAAYDELAQDRQLVFAAGLSMGGALALRLAALRPVAGVAAVNPALTIASRAAPLAPLLKYVMKSVPAIGNDIRLEGMDEGAYARTPVAAAAQLARLLRNTVRMLPQVTAPTLVFRSAVDHVVPPSSIALLRRHIGAEDVTVVPLPNSYHVATLDHDAELIHSGTVEFIRRIAKSRSYELI